MKFSSIFGAFSRRQASPEPFAYSVPTTFRNKTLMYCAETFNNQRNPWGGGQDYSHEIWSEIHKALLYRHGKMQLTDARSQLTPLEDVANFLLACKDEEFLDFLEYIFQVRSLFHVNTEKGVMVSELNELFASDSVGYELTPYIEERVVEPVNEYPFGGREHTVIKVVAYPKVIRKDSQVIHDSAIKPALELLSDPKYKSANQEFREALEDYRRGDYGDCLTKCGSAFESTMKIICSTKRWGCKQTDTASTLVAVMVKKIGLDAFFEQQLMIVATLRNKLSKSHGAGVEPRKVSQNLARYAINMTASAMVFLVNEAK
jgi:hypothetical protein